MSDVLTPAENTILTLLRDDHRSSVAAAVEIIDRLAAEVARLRAASEQRFACVHECDAEVCVDEDGCCVTCGGDTIVVSGSADERRAQREAVSDMLVCEFNDGQSMSDRELARLRERNERLEAVARAFLRAANRSDMPEHAALLAALEPKP